MVLQIAPDARQMVDDWNAYTLQVVGIAYATQQQQMWAADGSGAQNHFFASHNLVDGLLALEHDSIGAPVHFIDEHPVDVRVHGDVQIRSMAHRPEERLRRGAPASSAHRALRYLSRESGINNTKQKINKYIMILYICKIKVLYITTYHKSRLIFSITVTILVTCISYQI